MSGSTFKIPAGVLAQHVIALGKTRSGKSSKVPKSIDVDEVSRITGIARAGGDLQAAADLFS